MYNKLFSKIVDSTIWTEATSTRLVWITFLAVMDKTGFVQLASHANVAQRAVVSLEDATSAIEKLEGPDPNSSDPDNEGRRIERVNGGWIVLNAEKYRSIATREHEMELNRERVRRHRQTRSRNGAVMPANETVTPSEAEAVSSSKKKMTTPGKAREGSESGKKFANWFKGTLPQDLRLAAGWENRWALIYDDLLRLDKRSREQIHAVCKWAREDARFWQRNFLSPAKLRQRDSEGTLYFDVLTEAMKRPNPRPTDQAPNYAAGF